MKKSLLQRSFVAKNISFKFLFCTTQPRVNKGKVSFLFIPPKRKSFSYCGKKARVAQ
jgi:hypothetical protein